LHEQLAVAAIFARGGAWRNLPRMARVVRTWARADPRIEHWHLGPAAVERGRQRQGIGAQLMDAVCDELDRRGAPGYLETDKSENVRLYRRGGFEVVATRPVLGVTNWFMLRPAVGPARNRFRLTRERPLGN
jgi:GNAT superfamily N-acetyltransferase